MLKKLSIPHYLFLLLLASTWVVYNQHGSINDDGGLYIRQAYFFAAGDYSRAVGIYSWPLFGFLIGGLHRLTNIPLLYAAHAVDVVCFLTASFFFLKSLRLLSSDKNITLAGFLVLITSIPIVDDYLAMVLRDHGMWAGFMAGVYFFLRWRQAPTWSSALLWQSSFLIGTLFRPEVFVFNLLLPLVNVALPPKGKTGLTSLLQSASLLLVIGLGLLILVLVKLGVSGDASINLARLNEVVERPAAFMQNFLTPLPVVTSDVYLASVIRHHPLVLKLSFLSGVMVYKWLVAIGLLHAAAIYTALKYRLVKGQELPLLWTLFLITLLISIANFILSFVDTNRYWLMSYWLVYLLAALGLAHWIKKIGKPDRPASYFYAALLGLVLAAYSLVVLFDSKPHRPQEREVIRWLKAQQIDMGQVFFNDRRLIVYAERYGIEDIALLDDVLLRAPAYIVLRASQLEQAEQNLAGYTQLMQFSSDGAVSFIVYKKASLS